MQSSPGILGGRLAPGFTEAGSTKIALSWPPVVPCPPVCSVLLIHRTRKLGGEGIIKSTEQMGKLRPGAGQDCPASLNVGGA